MIMRTKLTHYIIVIDFLQYLPKAELISFTQQKFLIASLVPTSEIWMLVRKYNKTLTFKLHLAEDQFV